MSDGPEAPGSSGSPGDARTVVTVLAPPRPHQRDRLPRLRHLAALTTLRERHRGAGHLGLTLCRRAEAYDVEGYLARRADLGSAVTVTDLEQVPACRACRELALATGRLP